MKKLIKSFWEWVFSKTTIDEKVIKTAKEVSKRAKAVKQEVKDVAECRKRSW